MEFEPDYKRFAENILIAHINNSLKNKITKSASKDEIFLKGSEDAVDRLIVMLKLSGDDIDSIKKSLLTYKNILSELIRKEEEKSS